MWLVLSLVAPRYVDEASLSEGMRWVVRLAFPAAAILMPLAFFHFEVNGSSVPPDWQESKRRMRERETDASTRGVGAGFMAVARADDLKEGGMRAFRVLDTKIAVANVGGTFYAFDDTCTHEGCSLAEGELEETTVTCHCHGSRFDVTNGGCLRVMLRTRSRYTRHARRTATWRSRADV